ncbi:MAG: nucleotidyltransferase domain-containing protein [Candidatus Omnitrophota bacterium]
MFKEIRKTAKRLLKENSSVEKVVLFGSLAQDKATAFSDVDIIVVVNSSDKKFIDRPDDFRNYFQDMGIAVDLFIYTKEEAEKTPFAYTALSRGKCMAG